MTTLNNLKCIKVVHTYDSEVSVSYINYNQFETSFVKERWNSERRYNKTYTMFGYVHTKTIVTSPIGKKSVRVFEFPKSVDDAEKIHAEQMSLIG